MNIRNIDKASTRMSVGIRWYIHLPNISAAVLLFIAATAIGLGGQQTEEFRLGGDEVAIYNLTGTVELVRGTGADVTIQVTKAGPDAGRLSVETGALEGRQALRVIYPEDRIVYRGSGGNVRSTLRVGADGTFYRNFRDGREGRRVTVESDGSGLEAHANLRISVPSGKSVSVFLVVGDLTAVDIDGDLYLDVGASAPEVSGGAGHLSVDAGSGGLIVRDRRGEVVLDTGSGDVTVQNVEGDVDLDAGSGDIDMSGIQGSVNIDMGSGDLDLAQISGEEVNVDGGSGDLRLVDVEVDEINLDLGSGTVDLSGVRAPVVEIDGASGSITIALESDIDELTIDSQAGSVTVVVPPSLGAHLDIETNSGSIEVAVPTQATDASRREFSGRIGDGNGSIEIDTGSGDVTIRGG